MLSLRAKFDGKRIELPSEMRGAAPAEVLIVYPADEPKKRGGSIWDVFGKAPHPQGTEEINAQVRADRDEWDEH
jgi:hypothetical protein